jgi:hypothetical protein
MDQSHAIFIAMKIYMKETYLDVDDDDADVEVYDAGGIMYGSDGPHDLAGTADMHKILALHTPLHDATVGSGCKDKTQTCPT